MFVWFDYLRTSQQLSSIFLGWTSTKHVLMCLAQRHNALTPVRLESATPWSRVKHSSTEPLRSQVSVYYLYYRYGMHFYNPLEPIVYAYPDQSDEHTFTWWHFHFFLNINNTFCKQTVKILIKHIIMRYLIWVCSLCQCHINRTLGLYVLNCHFGLI